MLPAKLDAYQKQLNTADRIKSAVETALAGSGHYDTHREESRGWSAVFAGVALAVLAITMVTYALAMRAADLPTASAWVP